MKPAIGITQKINDKYFLSFSTDIKDIDIMSIARKITEKFNLRICHVYSTKNGYQLRWYYDQFDPHEREEKMGLMIDEYLDFVDKEWVYIVTTLDGNIRLSGKWDGSDITPVGKVVINNNMGKATRETGDTLKFFCEKISQDFVKQR